MPILDILASWREEIVFIQSALIRRVLGNERLCSDVLFEQFVVDKLGDDGYKRFDDRLCLYERNDVGR